MSPAATRPSTSRSRPVRTFSRSGTTAGDGSGVRRNRAIRAADLGDIRDNGYPFWAGRSTMADFQYYACVDDAAALCDLR